MMIQIVLLLEFYLQVGIQLALLVAISAYAIGKSISVWKILGGMRKASCSECVCNKK